MEKTYNYAGISKLKGKYKVRFSDRITYVKNLEVAGNTDIDLIELKEPMTKLNAVKYLLVINFDNGHQEIRDALESNLEVRYDKSRAKSGPIDDPVVYLREIATRLRELNELVARMTDGTDEEEELPAVVQIHQDDSLEDQPF